MNNSVQKSFKYIIVVLFIITQIVFSQNKIEILPDILNTKQKKITVENRNNERVYLYVSTTDRRYSIEPDSILNLQINKDNNVFKYYISDKYITYVFSDELAIFPLTKTNDTLKLDLKMINMFKDKRLVNIQKPFLLYNIIETKNSTDSIITKLNSPPLKYLTNQNDISGIYSGDFSNLILKLPILNIAKGLHVIGGLGYSHCSTKDYQENIVNFISSDTTNVGMGGVFYERVTTCFDQTITETTYQDHKPTGYIGIAYDLDNWSLQAGYSSTPQTKIVENSMYSINNITEMEIGIDNVENTYSEKELLNKENTIVNYSSGMAHLQIAYNGWGLGVSIRNQNGDNPFENIENSEIGAECSFRINLMGLNSKELPYGERDIHFSRKLTGYFNYHKDTGSSPLNAAVKYTKTVFDLDSDFNGYIIASIKTEDITGSIHFIERDYQSPSFEDNTRYVDMFEQENEFTLHSKLCFGAELSLLKLKLEFLKHVEIKPGFYIGLTYIRYNNENIISEKYYDIYDEYLFTQYKTISDNKYSIRVDLGTSLEISIKFDGLKLNNITFDGWSLDGNVLSGMGQKPTYLIGIGKRFSL